MKKTILTVLAVAAASIVAAQQPAQPVAVLATDAAIRNIIVLNKPNLQRGETIMQALAKRQSTRQFSDRELTGADLSDLLWAADGINRPEKGLRTAPSSRNRQDIYIYISRADGSYLYNPKDHNLEKVSDTDCRGDKLAPIHLFIVADTDDTSTGIDAGIVSQNVSLFCSGVGLATVCRTSMNRKEVAEGLRLPDGRHPVINHPVGYFK